MYRLAAKCTEKTNRTRAM